MENGVAARSSKPSKAVSPDPDGKDESAKQRARSAEEDRELVAKAQAAVRPAVDDRTEQRLRTLERIITDGRGRDDLAQQIENLRAKQLS